eukprot:3806120-Rhodomonas_salina.1
MVCMRFRRSVLSSDTILWCSPARDPTQYRNSVPKLQYHALSQYRSKLYHASGVGQGGMGAEHPRIVLRSGRVVQVAGTPCSIP